ncbi:MAG: hypothetical protein ACRD1J_07345 [Terriglobia bacterium]
MKMSTVGLFFAVCVAAGVGNARGVPNGAPRAGLASQASGQTAASTVNPTNTVQTGQLKSLLKQLFLDVARTQDLLGLLQPNQWKKTTDAQRAKFEQNLSTLRSQLDDLEKSRYAWLYSPDNPDYGKKTVDTLGSVVQQLRAVDEAVNRNQTAPSALSLHKAAEELAAAQGKLQDQLATMFPGRFAAQAPALAAAPSTLSTAAHAAPPAVAPTKSAKTLSATPVASSAAVTPSSLPGAATTTPPSRPSAPPPASVAPVAAPLNARQVKDLLSKIYLASARVNDLVGLAQPDQWKMNGADRGLLQEKLSSLRSQMIALEQARYKLFYNPEDPALAAQAAAALRNAVPAIRAIAIAVEQYDSASDAAQMNQPAGELAAAEGQLDSYSAYLQQRIQRQLAARPAGLPGRVTLETERISAPTPPPQPLKSVTIFTPPLTPAQVKAVLYKIYVSEFRIRDLLGQEHPKHWKASQAEQTLASQARESLLSQIAALETWRARLNQEPGNMYYAFQVFHAVDQVFHPLRVFSREVERYQGVSMGEPYRRRAADLEANLNALLPYVGAILEHASNDASMIQADLDTCQNQLTYAMHATLHSPTPLRNVVPVFEGRRARARRQAAKIKSSHP